MSNDVCVSVYFDLIDFPMFDITDHSSAELFSWREATSVNVIAFLFHFLVSLHFPGNIILVIIIIIIIFSTYFFKVTPDIVVALDVGSTNSGYAWQWRRDYDSNRGNVEFSTNWENAPFQASKFFEYIKWICIWYILKKKLMSTLL